MSANDAEREREYTVREVNTPDVGVGVGLHRFGEVQDAGSLEVRVSDPHPSADADGDSDTDSPPCGEWVRIEYIDEWGAVAPWGRTPDREYKICLEWSRVLVLDYDSGEIREARLSVSIPQLPYSASGVYEIDVGEHYSGTVTVLPWSEYVQGGMGYETDTTPDMAFEIDAVRAVGDRGAGGERE
jgi:hypothetical protein